MNSFKFAFKASLPLFKQPTLQKQFLARALQTFSNKHRVACLTKSNQFVYLNHQKYLSLSSIKFNEQQQQQETPKDEPPKKEEPKSFFQKLISPEHSWKLMAGIVGLMCGTGVFLILMEWGGPKYDENGILIRDEYTDLPAIIQYPKRAWQTAWLYWEMWVNPNSDKLLPEPLKEPYHQPRYTLVIELSGILVHPEWTIGSGWRYKKRPGLDYFIEQVKYPEFEVVLFCNEPYMSIAPVVASLDKDGDRFMYKLFRESTKYQNGVHIKDLSYLNRDLKRVILIDWDESAFQLQPRNALHRLKKYKGEDDDTDLVYLASFLKTIAASGVDDVRDVLDYYNSEVSPLETFKLNQVKLKESEEKRKKQLEEWKKKQSNNPFSWAKKLH